MFDGHRQKLTNLGHITFRFSYAIDWMCKHLAGHFVLKDSTLAGSESILLCPLSLAYSIFSFCTNRGSNHQDQLSKLTARMCRLCHDLCSSAASRRKNWGQTCLSRPYPPSLHASSQISHCPAPRQWTGIRRAPPHRCDNRCWRRTYLLS